MNSNSNSKLKGEKDNKILENSFHSNQFEIEKLKHQMSPVTNNLICTCGNQTWVFPEIFNSHIEKQKEKVWFQSFSSTKKGKFSYLKSQRHDSHNSHHTSSIKKHFFIRTCLLKLKSFETKVII